MRFWYSVAWIENSLTLLPLQAQVVLQGKSRSVIIRELQRTNLDVNLAVNNLLSRDDEDGDDGDDTASESYLPGGKLSQILYIFFLSYNSWQTVLTMAFNSSIEDLMSLLDADIHSAHPSVIIDADAMFSEDISYFGYPSFRRSSLSRLGSSRGKWQNTHSLLYLLCVLWSCPVRFFFIKTIWLSNF